MLNEKNWAGNLTYGAARLHLPETVGQVQEIVRNSRKLRALGSRHSFNNIADSNEDLVSLARLNRVVAIDPESRKAIVEGGIKYGELCPSLDKKGWALHNLASLPHISVAGACATATHGSGIENSNLAAAVSASELVTADGQLIEISRERDGEKFQGMVVGLGALGAVVKITLDLIPSFVVQQYVYENLTFSQFHDHLETIMSAAYSVCLFTDWQDERFTQVWVKHRVEKERGAGMAAEFFGATPASTPLHPISSMSPVSCTAQMGIPGPWYERLPHFRMDFTPSSGEELQSEYFVPQRHALAAIKSVARMSKHISPQLLVSEIRTVAADTLWMSPCYGEACMSIHFTWVKNWEKVRQVLPLIEEQLAPFQARPHWGKLFTMQPAQLQSLYARLPEFRALAESLDPHGKFRNKFLDTYVFG